MYGNNLQYLVCKVQYTLYTSRKRNTKQTKNKKQKTQFLALKPIMIYLDKAWEGVGVVASARKLIGSTDPLQAEPGTIRGDLAVQTGR